MAEFDPNWERTIPKRSRQQPADRLRGLVQSPRTLRG
jgi:hypothetical protein